ncbi:MAG: tetratricopeptide repeat protein, partial [Terriglobales bacterium]
WKCNLAAALDTRRAAPKVTAELYQQSVSGHGRLVIKAFLQYAGYLKANKRTNDALDALAHAEQLAPWYADIYSLRGDLLAGQNRLDQAEEEYKKAIALQPRNGTYYALLANFYRDHGRVEDALAQMMRCTTVVPASGRAWLTLGDLYVKKGDWARAQTAYQSALALCPKANEQAGLNVLSLDFNGKTHAGIGACFYKTNDYKKALQEAILFNSLKFDPKLPAYLKVMKVRPGRIDFAHLLAKEREAAEHAMVADMLAETRQLDDSAKEYRIAIELSPNDVDLHSYLLNIYTESGNWMGSAKEDWEISNKLMGKVPHELGKMFEEKKKKSPNGKTESGSQSEKEPETETQTSTETAGE